MQLIRPTGSPTASIMIVEGIPNAESIRKGLCLQGSSGWELDKLLKTIGVQRDSCFVTSICRQAPTAGWAQYFPLTKKQINPDYHVLCRGKWVSPVVVEGLALVEREIEMVKPSLIITLGDEALWAMAGKDKASKWRGSMLLHASGIRVLPTYHPNEIFGQWHLRPVLLQDLRRAIHYQGIEWPTPTRTFTIRPTFEQVTSRLTLLLTQLEEGEKRLAYDIETLASNISCIGLAWSKSEAICIPFMKMGQEEGYFTEAEEAEVLYLLYIVMAHPHFKGITQNGLFDTQYILKNWHFIPRHYQDTMISQHTLFPGMQKSLAFICSFHNESYIYWKDDLKEWKTTIVHDEEQYWNYNCEDCVRTFEAAQSLEVAVDKMGLRGPHDFQQSLFSPVLGMMVRGMDIDFAAQKEVQRELKISAAACLDWIHFTVGYPLNISSPKQMAQFFYIELKQPKIVAPGTQNATCNEAALVKIAIREPLLKPLIDKMLELRSLGVYLSHFLEDKRDKDGRLRCSYNIAGTKTFRFSSSENVWGRGYNLQTVPKGEE